MKQWLQDFSQDGRSPAGLYRARNLLLIATVIVLFLPKVFILAHLHADSVMSVLYSHNIYLSLHVPTQRELCQPDFCIITVMHKLVLIHKNAAVQIRYSLTFCSFIKSCKIQPIVSLLRRLRCDLV